MEINFENESNVHRNIQNILVGIGNNRIMQISPFEIQRWRKQYER